VSQNLHVKNVLIAKGLANLVKLFC